MKFYINIAVITDNIFTFLIRKVPLIIDELISTEREYVRSLKYVIEVSSEPITYIERYGL